MSIWRKIASVLGVLAGILVLYSMYSEDKITIDTFKGGLVLVGFSMVVLGIACLANKDIRKIGTKILIAGVVMTILGVGSFFV